MEPPSPCVQRHGHSTVCIRPFQLNQPPPDHVGRLIQQERSGENERVVASSTLHTEYTPSCITNTTVFSQARTCVLVAHELQRHLCAHEKSLSSGQPCHFLAGFCLTFSLSVHHNTKHHLDSTTFSTTTLYTEHLQNLYSRQAAQMNRSRTSITRVAETRATPLPLKPMRNLVSQTVSRTQRFE